MEDSICWCRHSSEICKTNQFLHSFIIVGTALWFIMAIIIIESRPYDRSAMKILGGDSGVNSSNGALAPFMDGVRCLEESDSIYGKPNLALQAYDQRKEHFDELMIKLAKYRKVVSHCWVGYCGPWAEEYYVSILSNLEYSQFGPFVPLFVNWLDLWKNPNYVDEDYCECLRHIFSMLRSDMLYITVSSHDYGLEANMWTGKVPPNLLIVSAAGYGHIPFFDLIRDIDVASHKRPSKYSLVFMGNAIYKHRIDTLNEARSIFGNKFHQGLSHDWKNEYAKSKVVISPRGNAKGCFRHSEILQMGFIPFFTSIDYPWVPYINSNLPWDKMAFFADQNSVIDVLHKIDRLSEDEADKMRETILKYRDSHFTAKGSVNQILLFMQEGYKGSDLRCAKFELYNGRRSYDR